MLIRTIGSAYDDALAAMPFAPNRRPRSTTSSGSLDSSSKSVATGSTAKNACVARDLVAGRRRFPSTCLYCDAPADSEEHPVPRAMGGRLRAPILCGRHNNLASRADHTLSTHFAAWTHMLGVPKQGRGRGTSFKATSVDGRDITVHADGYAVEPNRVVERDDDGRVVRAEGSARWIDRLQAAKERSGPGPFMPTIEVLGGEPPIVELHFGLTREVEPGLVKCALHFVAGFVADVVVPDELRDVIERNETPEKSGVYVRPVPFTASLFGDPRPPRHEVTVYPGSTAAFVTLMLYGAFSVVVRLSGIKVHSAVRYVQLFDGSGPRLMDVPLCTVPWDEPMSATEWEALKVSVNERAARIERVAHMRQHHDLCTKAARAAEKNRRRYNADFIDLFRAELDKYGWSAQRKDDAVADAMRIVEGGGQPWTVPLTDEEDAPEFVDGSQ